MLVRSALTLRPVLAGLVPDGVCTVSRGGAGTDSGRGVAAPTPVGEGGATTVKLSKVLPARPCRSLTLIGKDFAPTVVAGATVALNDQMPSPAVTAPCKPASWKAAVALPPMLLRSPATMTLVLAGLEPPVTVAVSSVVEFTGPELGEAEPATVGAVEALIASGMTAEPERPCASLMVAASVLPPEVTLSGTTI